MPKLQALATLRSDCFKSVCDNVAIEFFTTLGEFREAERRLVDVY